MHFNEPNIVIGNIYMLFYCLIIIKTSFQW